MSFLFKPLLPPNQTGYSALNIYIFNIFYSHFFIMLFSWSIFFKYSTKVIISKFGMLQGRGDRNVTITLKFICTSYIVEVFFTIIKINSSGMEIYRATNILLKKGFIVCKNIFLQCSENNFNKFIHVHNLNFTHIYIFFFGTSLMMHLH